MANSSSLKVPLSVPESPAPLHGSATKHRRAAGLTVDDDKGVGVRGERSNSPPVPRSALFPLRLGKDRNGPDAWSGQGRQGSQTPTSTPGAGGKQLSLAQPLLQAGGEQRGAVTKRAL